MIESKSLGVLDHPHSRGRTVLYPDAPSTSLRAERGNPCIRAASIDCFVARAPRNDEERLSLMAHHVDDNSIGIPDEKSPDAPWLVGGDTRSNSPAAALPCSTRRRRPPRR